MAVHMLETGVCLLKLGDGQYGYGKGVWSCFCAQQSRSVRAGLQADSRLAWLTGTVTFCLCRFLGLCLGCAPNTAYQRWCDVVKLIGCIHCTFEGRLRRLRAGKGSSRTSCADTTPRCRQRSVCRTWLVGHVFDVPLLCGCVCTCQSAAPSSSAYECGDQCLCLLMQQHSGSRSLCERRVAQLNLRLWLCVRRSALCRLRNGGRAAMGSMLQSMRHIISVRMHTSDCELRRTSLCL
jgi:hypothetical protein